MAPVLNQVSISMADTIQVVKIDTEKYPQIADKYNIAALPTFILFKDGKPFDRFVSSSSLPPSYPLITRLPYTYNIYLKSFIFIQYVEKLKPYVGNFCEEEEELYTHLI